MLNPFLIERAKRYARKHGRFLGEWLGGGADGEVWELDGNVIKAIVDERKYRNESQCYLRLTEHNIQSLCGFAVPRLIGLDDDLYIVEMGFVSPPYLLDFGKAYLDVAPDYYTSETKMADCDAERRENFGDDHWQVVRQIHACLKQVGIYYMDTKPGNITFAEGDESDE